MNKTSAFNNELQMKRQNKPVKLCFAPFLPKVNTVFMKCTEVNEDGIIIPKHSGGIVQSVVPIDNTKNAYIVITNYYIYLLLLTQSECNVKLSKEYFAFMTYVPKISENLMYFTRYTLENTSDISLENIKQSSPILSIMETSFSNNYYIITTANSIYITKLCKY